MFIQTAMAIQSAVRIGLKVCEFIDRRNTKMDLRNNCERILNLYANNNGMITKELKDALMKSKSLKKEYRECRKVSGQPSTFIHEDIVSCGIKGIRSAAAVSKIRKLPSKEEIEILLGEQCSKSEKNQIISKFAHFLGRDPKNYHM